jgi:ActR/RegA family two-component response regulator
MTISSPGATPDPSTDPQDIEGIESNGSGPPVRLLLVDDEPGLRTAVKAYLEDEGFDVTTANDGEEGWTGPRRWPPTW